MDLFTRDDLRNLMDVRSEASLSAYMPTHRTGREIRDDALRCKNLLNAAEDQLRDAGLRTPQAKELLKSARQLQGDDEFWKDQSDGLAFFAAPGLFRFYRVPLMFEEMVVVNRRFHVKPILPLLQGDGRFYLLAASQKRLRFFEGTHYSISELDPQGLPKSLEDALNIDEYVQAMQSHSYTTTGIGKAAGPSGAEAMFHGHGASDLDVKKKDEILQYFHRVDHGLHEFFGEERSPLVFAGVEYLFPIFRQANSYRLLIDKPIPGNPNGWNLSELHSKAWPIVEPHFREDQQRALEKFGRQVAGPLASDNLEETISAVRQGRVETLFVMEGQHCWGTIDEQTGEVTRCDKYELGVDDLLDYAAVQTLLTGGAVYALPRDRMPRGQLIAAVFRYAAVSGSPE